MIGCVDGVNYEGGLKGGIGRCIDRVCSYQDSKE